jgi:hypothetical protein
MISEPLNKAELELISKLLEMASDEFSNHGCNDIEIRNTPANCWLMQEYEKDNNPSDPYQIMFSEDNKYIYANDAALMSYMSRRAKVASTLENVEHE